MVWNINWSIFQSELLKVLASAAIFLMFLFSSPERTASSVCRCERKYGAVDFNGLASLHASVATSHTQQPLHLAKSADQIPPNLTVVSYTRDVWNIARSNGRARPVSDGDVFKRYPDSTGNDALEFSLNWSVKVCPVNRETSPSQTELLYAEPLFSATTTRRLKAKFHYACWFKAGSKMIADLQRAEIWPII